MGDEFCFPEPAIERIQCFLNSKEAAQTIILSESWHNVWLIRPNLDFKDSHHLAKLNYSHFNEGRKQFLERRKQFLEFVDKTIQRYEKSNLKIETFKLDTGGFMDLFLHVKELIRRALKIGATHLTLNLNLLYLSYHPPTDYSLPDEMFESAEYLTLKCCVISPKPLVRCSRLQSLSLYRIELKYPNTISHILSSCPFILKLSLYDVSLVKPYDFRDGDFGGYYDNYPINDEGYITNPHMRLTTLVLKYVYFDILFLGDLSTKFPLLKELTLYMSIKKRQEDIFISSPSLERLHFKLKNIDTYTRLGHPYKRQRVTFDFPCIRMFTYIGSVIPLLSFESNSRDWESHLSIRRRHKCLNTSWFRRLSDLLTKLRRSSISLSLHVRSKTSFNYEVGDIQGLHTREIENLTIDHQHLSSLTCYALLDGLFRMCRPKLITQSVSTCFRVKKKHIELMGHVLLNGVLVDNEELMLTPSQFMYGLNDLKEANAQIFDKVVSTWRDATLDALLFNHLQSAKDEQQIRFQLNWQISRNRNSLNN